MSTHIEVHLEYFSQQIGTTGASQSERGPGLTFSSVLCSVPMNVSKVVDIPIFGSFHFLTVTFIFPAQITGSFYTQRSSGPKAVHTLVADFSPFLPRCMLLLVSRVGSIQFSIPTGRRFSSHFVFFSWSAKRQLCVSDRLCKGKAAHTTTYCCCRWRREKL